MWHTGVFHIVERQAEEANAAISRKRFSSKVISCNATTERDDELYLSYCSLSSDEQRKQMRQFHGKVFCQKVLVATQRQSEAMSCTCRTAHCRATRRDANDDVSRKRFSSNCCICNSATERDDVAYWRIPHCRATSRGSRCGNFTEKFLSKGVSCNATTERGDELYLSYCSLPSDEARTQMMTFHGKDFRQKRYYTTQTKISRTGSTGVRPRSGDRVHGSRMLLFTKKIIPSTTPPLSPSVRRGRWRRRSYL